MGARSSSLPVAQPVAPRGSGFFGRLDSIARDPRDPQAAAQALFATVLALCGLGLLVQAGYAATVLERADFRNELLEQIGVRIAAAAVLLGASHLGPRAVRRFIPHAAVLSLIALALVFVPGIGTPINGASRWIDVFGITFQPSELARIVVVLWVANHCVLYGDKLSDLRRAVLPILLFASVFFLLVYFERDVGGAILLMVCVLSTLWVGGARTGHVGTFMIGGVGMALGVGLATAPHVKHRILTWLNLAENDQVSHAAQAVSRGGWLGQGFTHGEARLANVPHLESDFVLAQVGEEFGWVGAMIVLALYAAFAWFALRLVLSIDDRFEALAAFGLLVATLLQAMIHIEVVAGLGPPKGMPLPFVSNGGSSLLVSSLAVGLALGAARNRVRTSARGT